MDNSKQVICLVGYPAWNGVRTSGDRQLIGRAVGCKGGEGWPV